MNEPPARDTAEIQSLLEDRQRLQDWLLRLDRAEAPDAVRQRVRADYEGRLAEVVVRLGSFSDTLSGSLEEHRARLGEVEGQKQEIEEERAEAHLRHAVGEFSDEEWNRLDAEASTRIEGFDTEIGDLTGEISRLEEVLGQIVPEASSPTDGEDLSDLEVQPLHPPETRRDAIDDSREDVRGRSAEAPRFTPKGGESRRESGGGRTLRFPSPAPVGEPEGQVDEMTFIKSVALEAGGTEEPGARGGASKTLKCAECGSMNRPTEWYCERCGAELAAL